MQVSVVYRSPAMLGMLPDLKIFANLAAKKWYILVVFICISLLLIRWWNVSYIYSHSCASSFVKPVCIFAHFSVRFFDFSFIHEFFVDSLYYYSVGWLILNTIPLSVAKIISHFIGWLSTIFRVSFDRKSPHLIVLLFEWLEYSWSFALSNKSYNQHLRVHEQSSWDFY